MGFIVCPPLVTSAELNSPFLPLSESVVHRFPQQSITPFWLGTARHGAKAESNAKMKNVRTGGKFSENLHLVAG